MAYQDKILQNVLFFSTSFLVLFPIAVIIYQSFLSAPLYEPTATITLSKYIEVLTDPKFQSILFNTIIIGVISAITSTILGVLFAISIERTDLPYKNILKMMIIMPIIMPLVVAAVAWTLMFGRNGFITLLLRAIFGFTPWDIHSLVGVGMIIGFYYLPYPFLFVLSALSMSNPELEDSSRACGANIFYVLRKITIPLLRPTITYSLLLVFIIGMEQLSIPLILGSPYGIEVLMTYLYEIGIRGLSDWPATGVISVILLSITTTLTTLSTKYIGAERRYISVGGKAVRPRLVRLGRWRILILTTILLYIFLTLIIPTVGIIMRAFTKVFSPLINIMNVLTLANFEFLKYSEYLMSIPNTLIVSALGATLGAFYAFFNSATAKRAQFKGGAILEYVSMYPRAIPGLVLGMGFLWMFLLIEPLRILRPTLVALMIAYVARYITYGYASITPALMRVSQELDYSARASGATWTCTQRKILLPLLKPAILSTWLLLFITFLREYATAIFLYVPQTRVLGVTILEFWNQGELGPIAALSLIQVALVLFSYIIIQRIFRVRVYG